MRRIGLVILLAFALSQGVAAADNSLPALLERYRAEPASASLCEQIGVAYTRGGQLENAADFFRKAVKLQPGAVSSRKNLATVLWFLNQKSEAERIFAVLEKVVPKDPVPQLYLGLAAYEANNYSQAAAHFERAGPLASDNPELLPVVIDTYLSAKQFERATSILEARTASADCPSEVYRWLAQAYDGQQLPDKAYKAYSTAIEKDPALEENYLALASFAIEHANPAYARDVLNRGLLHTPASAKLRFELGLTFALDGDFPKARTAFVNAASADGRWPLPLLALGVMELQTGDAEAAAKYFRQAKDIAPNDYRCYYLHAMALNRSAKRDDAETRAEVVSELRHALSINPKEPRALADLAQAELESGNKVAAEADLRKALRLNPAEPTALYRLGLLCRQQGKTAEAERLMRAFQQSKQKTTDAQNEFVLMLRTLNGASH
jgi:Flp pilus assembly protein TadD